MSITTPIATTSEKPAKIDLSEVGQSTDLTPTQAKAESCFTEAVRTVVPASTELVLTSEDIENIPEKMAVSFFDSSSKKTIPGFLTRKFDDGDVSYNAIIKDGESIGSLSMEVLGSKLWIHTMKNNSLLSGVGKAFIEAAKHEAELQCIKEIGLIAIGDSHTFYVGCGFTPIPSEESETINSLLKSNYLESKEKGTKVSTSYLGPVEMSLKL